jgi:CBS domain-containing protein
MGMRFSAYLAQLPPDIQRALTDDLTLGAGRVALVTRMHQQDSTRTVTVLSTLAGAYAALRSARAMLDGETDPPDDHLPRPTRPASALPARWDAVVEDAGAEVVGAWLQMTAEMMRDAILAVTHDADVTEVRDLVDHALGALAMVRDDALMDPEPGAG